MGRDAKARHVDADDADTIDLGRKKLERDAGSRWHAEVCHDDSIVAIRVSQFMHSIADVFEKLAGDQSFGIEGHITHRAPRAVEVADEGQAIDATGAARKHGRHPPHPQAHAKRAEGRAHGLRLVVRALRIVAGKPVEEFRVPRRAGHSLHFGPGMTAQAVGRKPCPGRLNVRLQLGHAAFTSRCRPLACVVFF